MANSSYPKRKFVADNFWNAGDSLQSWPRKSLQWFRRLFNYSHKVDVIENFDHLTASDEEIDKILLSEPEKLLAICEGIRDKDNVLTKKSLSSIIAAAATTVVGKPTNLDFIHCLESVNEVHILPDLIAFSVRRSEVPEYVQVITTVPLDVVRLEESEYLTLGFNDLDLCSPSTLFRVIDDVVLYRKDMKIPMGHFIVLIVSYNEQVSRKMNLVGPSTGKIPSLLDRALALEKKMQDHIQQNKLSIKPQIFIVAPFLPNARKTCKIGKKIRNCRLLGVPFGNKGRTHDNSSTTTVERDEFAKKAVSQIMEHKKDNANFIIGSDGVGNLIAYSIARAIEATPIVTDDSMVASCCAFARTEEVEKIYKQ